MSSKRKARGDEKRKTEREEKEQHNLCCLPLFPCFVFCTFSFFLSLAREPTTRVPSFLIIKTPTNPSHLFSFTQEHTRSNPLPSSSSFSFLFVCFCESGEKKEKCLVRLVVACGCLRLLPPLTQRREREGRAIRTDPPVLSSLEKEGISTRWAFGGWSKGIQVTRTTTNEKQVPIF